MTFLCFGVDYLCLNNLFYMNNWLYVSINFINNNINLSWIEICVDCLGWEKINIWIIILSIRTSYYSNLLIL